MSILLWVLQVLLALHTVMGAVWKFSNSEQSVPSLAALPHGVWVTLSVFEIFCAVGLVLPAIGKSLGFLVPLAAAGILAEMLLFTFVNLSSGSTKHSEIIYWLIVAGFCAFIAYGRLAIRPL
jgi:hypothetical protein